MHRLQIAPVHQNTFDAEALLEGLQIAVRFSGTADLVVKATMNDFLNQVHNEAIRLNLSAVNVDVSGLEFINSSCLMAFVTWITTVQAMVNRRYHIAFHFEAVRDWHRRSFDVLSQLGEDVVTVKATGETTARRNPSAENTPSAQPTQVARPRR